jgi:predicted nucleic acid-binding protein
MSVEAFLDTNVLVYAAAGADGEGEENAKRQRALQLIEEEDFGLSAQVLQEFFVNVTRKIEVPLSPSEALEWMEELEAFPCLPIDRSLVKIAVEVSARYQISYWDGAILAAAQSLGASTLYTEDLNDGQRYGSVQVRNPFRQAEEAGGP